jgi:hypothetical protein
MYDTKTECCFHLFWINNLRHVLLFLGRGYCLFYIWYLYKQCSRKTGPEEFCKMNVKICFQFSTYSDLDLYIDFLFTLDPAVLIRIWIHRIHMFLDLLDPSNIEQK